MSAAPQGRLKLPREIEATPEQNDAISKVLAESEGPLWEGGRLRVARLPLSPTIEDALLQALNFRKLERGLEQAEKILGAEQKGLLAVQAKQGAAPAQRVSRLLVIARDGAERFNRACESLLARHSDRVLGMLVDVDSERLGLALFGPGKAVKALLVTDRDAVTRILRSLIKK